MVEKKSQLSFTTPSPPSPSSKSVSQNDYIHEFNLILEVQI